MFNGNFVGTITEPRSGVVERAMWNDAKKVFSINACEVWGGPRDSLYDEEWDLVVRLHGQAPPSQPPVVMTGFKNERLSVSPTPTLWVRWEDMGVPALGKKWWVSLFEELEGRSGRVLVHCEGGHGRTGTALAILVQIYHEKKYPSLPKWAKGKKDALGWVRDNYDELSLETAGQLAYVKKMGVKTGEQYSHAYKYMASPSASASSSNVTYYGGSAYSGAKGSSQSTAAWDYVSPRPGDNYSQEI